MLMLLALWLQLCSDSLRLYRLESTRLLLSMEFSRQEYWSGLPFPPPGNLPNPATEHGSLACPALVGRFFTRWAMREGHVQIVQYISSQEAHLCNLPPGEEAEHSLPSGSARSTLTWSLLTSYHVTTTLTFTTIGYLFFLFLFNFKWRPCVLSDSRMSEGLARWC